MQQEVSFLPEEVKIDFKKKKIKIPKVGWMPFDFDGNEEISKGELKLVTVIRKANNEWFISLLIDDGKD